MTNKKLTVFETLSAINVNDHTNEKGGLTYLPWSFAWGELQKAYPESSYEFLEPVWYQDRTCEVSVAVTVEGVTRSIPLPCMNYKNAAIVEPNARDISDTRMRCLVKAIALHGLGLYIYGGEDLPGAEVEANKKHADETYNAVLELITANDIALVQVWSECDRNLQSTVWKMLTTAQKATAKELLDSVRAKEEK